MNLKDLKSEHKKITAQINELRKRRRAINKQIRNLKPDPKPISSPKPKTARDVQESQWKSMKRKDKRQYLIDNRSCYEVNLGTALKNLGVKFDIQTPIHQYFADFTIPSIRLVVEVDGSTHDSDEAKRYDADRTRSMQKIGWRVIRFPNEEIANDVVTVAQKIKDMTCRVPGSIVVVPPKKVIA